MPEEQKIAFQRGDSYESLYANNVQFEASVWDLKAIFGQLDQAESRIEQHTAITMPWVHVKIAAYYLLMNVIAHEAIEGPIKVSPRVTPPRPDSADPTVEASAKPTVEYLAWVHDQFFGSNPYIPPSVATAQAESPKVE
jgi:hypothetical protein